MHKRQGYPELDDIVICTVKKVLYNAVFISLDEYNREGIIHISEIAPGRIRNIRDYVKVGKKVICKILRVNKDKGHIDLSLRRVNRTQRINKSKEIKQEQKAEKILESAAKKLSIEKEEIYKKAGDKIIESYGNLTPAFYDIISGNLNLDDLKIDKKISEEITKIVKEKIKQPTVEVSGILKLENSEPDGITRIKKSLKQTILKNKLLKISYLGAPKYKVSLTAPDYKKAETKMKKITDEIIKEMEKNKGSAEFQRSDK